MYSGTTSDRGIYRCLDDIRNIISGNVLKRIMFLTPFAPTITTTPISVFSSTLTNPAAADISKSAMLSQSISIKVQSMGTATAVNIGTSRSQTSTLTSVGDVFVVSVPWGMYFDANDIWAAANLGTTTILEVSGLVYSPNQNPVVYVPGSQV